MRTRPFPLNATDAVHIYSDEQCIWLQLRRHVPTEIEIGSPSFKTAMCLTRNQAIAIAGALLAAATDNEPQPIATKKPNPPAIPVPPANHGKPWTPAEEKKLCDGFDANIPTAELARRHMRGIGGIESRLIKLNKLRPEDRTSNAAQLDSGMPRI